jgi:hypothetical protein
VRAGVVLVAMAAGSSSAYAQSSPALDRARSAWDSGELDAAGPLYQKALEAGGLAPADVLDAYVHLGAALAVAGKPKPALDAFRQAAALDGKFHVPPEAGKKAVAVAEQARKEKGRGGDLALSAEIPSGAKAGAPFAVKAAVDGGHLGLVDQVRIEVRDSLSGRSFDRAEPAAAQVRFEVPTRMTLPGARLVVHIDALDTHANRLASLEEKVTITDVVAREVAASPIDETQGKDKDKKEGKSSGGFWSTPWPYVIGGVALAAGGTAVYFATRPGDEVTVGAARVQLVH